MTRTLPASIRPSAARITRRAALLVSALVLAGCGSLQGGAPRAAAPAAASSAPVYVMTSGGFTAAYNDLRPAYEKQSGRTVQTAYGASMGNASDAIPTRLGRGEPADVVILARDALDALVKAGKVVPGSQVDLVRSSIGLAVKKGAPRPDIGTVEALKRTLLAAPSIAYSASASGTYYETEMLKTLGIESQVMPKSRRILSERVGTVVARGDAALGLQQVSELLPIEGIDYLGPLPAEVQRVTVFSAGIATASTQPEAARDLIRYLQSPAAAPTIRKTGLEPIPAP